jgi:hypothetical protein
MALELRADTMKTKSKKLQGTFDDTLDMEILALRKCFWDEAMGANEWVKLGS